MAVKGKRNSAKKNISDEDIIDLTATDDEMAACIPRQILLCSIGNPGALMGTRHSAAHYLLPHIATSQLSVSRAHGGSIAPGPSNDKYSITCFQSPQFMNVSGKAVKSAWKEFRRTLTAEETSRAVLVVMHDELEKGFGQVKLKKTGSASGHNGISSTIESLGTKEFLRLGLGIGRPESRTSEDVARYVLSKMTSFEKEQLDTNALPKVWKMLDEIATSK